MTNPLTKRIEDVLINECNLYNPTDNDIRDAAKALTTLFKEELEALAGEVEELKKFCKMHGEAEGECYGYDECYNQAINSVLALIRSKATRI